jgi:hypothetical protein
MGTRRATTFEDPTIVSPKARERAFGQADHVRIYGLDYKARLESVGFVVSVDPLVRELPMAVRTRFALSPEEDVSFCVKPPRAGRAHATRRLPSKIAFIDRCLVQDLRPG